MNAATLRIPVDLANPGQFFACCGLLELADRLDQTAQARFDSRSFVLQTTVKFEPLMQAFIDAECNSLEPNDLYTPALFLAGIFNLRLDWWQDQWSGGKALKTWAGQQRVQTIFDLMRRAVDPVENPDRLLDHADAVRDTNDGKPNAKTASPFYFDSRRSATALDIGFSPDAQGMSVICFPAVEALALVGIQRFRPTAEKHDFSYFAWESPLPVNIAAAATAIGFAGGSRYTFSTASRGGDYHKMFTSSKLERIIP